MNQSLLVAITSILASGCALQVTGGYGSAKSSTAAAATVSATTQAYRRNALILGARMGARVDDAIVPRNAAVHGGYDMRIVPGRLAFEPGLDLGVGGPIVSPYSGAGAYAGAAGNLKVRLFGVDDDEPAFNLVAPGFELVVAGRGGFWAPPEGAASQAIIGEWTVEGGIRLTLGSDIFGSPNGKVQEPKEQPPTGGK